MSNNSYLENMLTTSEVKITLCMLNDISNYDSVISKVRDLSFKEPLCNKMLNIMNDMYTKLGYTKIDRVSLIGYCDRVQFDESIKKQILNTFDTIKDFFGTSNFEFDGVFEEYSMISSTYKFYSWVVNCGGIDEVANKLLKLKNMEEVNRVIEGRLLEFFNTGTSDASIIDTDITDTMNDDFIESVKNGEDTIETIPLLSQFVLLNKITKGFVRGSTGFGGHSGFGKSSFMYSVYVMSLLENSKSKICIYANEQTAKVFATGMVFAFISQVFNMKQEEFGNVGYINISRDKYVSGALDDVEIKKFISMIKLFRSRYRNRITHSYFEDMTPNALRRDISKKVRTGHKFFFFDTFKDPDEDYAKLMKLATVFDQQTKKYNIHAYSSLQLSDESIGTRYLTNRCLASARGVKRVMETLLLGRKLELEELPSLIVHKLGKPEQTISINLHNKNYCAIFIDKNRNGSDGIVLLYEVYLDILKYKEIGVIANMPKDDFKFSKKKK